LHLLEDGRIVLRPNAEGQYDGLCGQALNTRQPFYINQPPLSLFSENAPVVEALAVHRLLAVPVVLGNELVGQIVVCNAERDYSDRDLSAIQRLAERYSLTLQRLRFKHALQAERDFVQAIVTTAGALVVVLDREGRVVRFNQACEQASGYSFEEVAGQVFWELFLLPEELASFKGVFAKLMAGQFPAACENTWRTRQGDRRRILWSNTVLLDEKRHVQYVIATGVDVTQIQTAESKLRVLTRAMEAGPSSVVITDAEGTITYVNPAFAHLTGYAPEEVIGKTPRVWKSGHHSREFYAGFWQTLKRGWEWRGEFCNKKKSGDLFWIYSAISPIRDDAGEITHFVSITVDITERKRYERALEQSREELESRVAERTADLERTVQSLLREVEARRRAESEIQELLEFERLVTEIATEVAQLQSGGFVELVKESIARLMTFLKAERGALCEFVGERIVPWVLCSLDSCPPAPLHLEASDLPWSLAQLRCGKKICFAEVSELPAEAAADQQTCRKTGVHSLIALPLLVSGNAIGTLVFASMSRARAWPSQSVQRLSLVEGLFAGLLFRWRSEQALTEAEKRFHAVADFTQDWEYWQSPDGVMLFCSPACERITGYGPQHFLSKPGLLPDIVLPEDAVLWREFHRQSLAEPRQRKLQFRIRTAGGEVRWSEHHCTALTDAEGHFLGLRASNRDCTEEKLAELESQRLREDLARVTRITTADHLAASLAHELRQPLAAILSNAEAAQQFLQSQPPDLGEVREALQDLVHNNERASQVIQRLRALYRRSGQERTPLELNRLIEDTLELLRSELILRQVSWREELVPSLPLVSGNPVEIQQVLMNLILNARDAVLPNSPEDRRLVVSTACDAPGYIRVSVSDSGPGVEPAMAAQIFEPFVTTKESGMGIGLTICRSILEAHDGRLWVVNNPHRGATFHFTLPVLDNINP
jgi:PAS domain S-box-containing protein